MELRDYIQIITRRGWIIILTMVLTMAAAFGMSRVQTPVYRSTVFLNVFPGRLDWSLQQTIKGVLRNFAGTITSRTTALEVVSRLQLDITPEQLAEKLTVRAIESDMLIQIDADDFDPLIARDVAQTTAEVFVEDAKALMQDQDASDRVEVSIRDYALPGVLHKPKWKINVMAGAVFGGLIGIVIVFVLRFLESDIVHSAKDLEEYTGLAVLGLIPTVTGGSGKRTNNSRARRREQIHV